MSNPFIGEIKVFAGNFCINHYAFCAGQIMSIAQNTALFSLLGTYYGGDGHQTFALPDLRGRIPVGQGSLAGGGDYQIGQSWGMEEVTLTTNQIPAHRHSAVAVAGAGTAASPTGAAWAGSALNAYSIGANPTPVAMSPLALASAGGSGAHENRMPFLALNFLIALVGVFPARS